jgi:hypothetical protein
MSQAKLQRARDMAQAGKTSRCISAATGLPLIRVRKLLRAIADESPAPRPRPAKAPEPQPIAVLPPPVEIEPKPKGKTWGGRQKGTKLVHFTPPGNITPAAEALIARYDYLTDQFPDPSIKACARKLLRDQAILWVQENYQGDPTDRFTYFVSFAPARYDWTQSAEKHREAKAQ